MENKLAGLMAMMAFIILAAAWLVRKLIGLPVMNPVQILSILLFILPVYYFIVGRVIARIGIALVQEDLSEKRQRDARMMHRSRMLQQEMAAMSQMPEPDNKKNDKDS